MMDTGYPAVAFAVGDELEKALARIRELEGDNANLRDFAYNRAPKIAAEECNRQKAEFEAQLAEANDRAAHHEAARLTYYDELCGVKAQLAEANTRADIWERNYKASEFTTTKQWRERAEKAEADAATLRAELDELKRRFKYVAPLGLEARQPESG